MNFVDMLMYYGRANPEKQAIILPDRLISFGMLANGIRSAETAIAAASLDQQQIVAVRVDNQIRHLIIVSALYRMGIVSVSVTGETLLLQAGVKVDALISDEDKPLPDPTRVVLIEDDWFARPFEADAPRPTGFANEDALARIIMSSGTTAAPKAIGMSARVVEDRIVTGRRTLTLTPWDRMMCLPVLTSSLGFGSALQALAYGHSLVFADSAIDALQMIALYGVDLVIANPQHLKGMVQAHRRAPVPTPSLKLIKYGGNSMGPDLIPEVRARLCKEILCVYSSTESGPVAFASIDRILEHPASTGFVAPWIDVEIMGPDEKPLPRGQEGRLRIRSKWQGYDVAIGPQAAAQWMYPGDIGRISETGMLTLIGRTADAIDIGGIFVSPEQLERELSGYPGLIDVAAVGMPAAGGRMEIWVAAIARGERPDPQAIKDFLLSKNPLWKVAHVRFVERLRRNEMGKLVRSRIKEVLLGA
jgi:acyl-coenzyme A synthetase/AMP-(fatty) acid ligase